MKLNARYVSIGDFDDLCFQVSFENQDPRRRLRSLGAHRAVSPPAAPVRGRRWRDLLH